MKTDSAYMVVLAVAVLALGLAAFNLVQIAGATGDEDRERQDDACLVF